MCLRDVEAGMNRELATVRRDSHAEFSESISISHTAALTRAITERAATVFHVFFFPSSSPLLILPELTPWDRSFPFDVADTHFLRRQTNKPHHHHSPTPPQKSPTQPRPPLLTGENLRSAALHFLGPERERRGGEAGGTRRGTKKRRAEIKPAQRLI